MQTLVAHFEDPQTPEEASDLLGTPATQLSDADIRSLFKGDPDSANWYGSVFSITVPKEDAQERLTSNIFESTGEGYEDLGEDGFTRVYYKVMPSGFVPGGPAAAAGRKRRAKKTLRKKRKLTRKSRKRA